MENSDNSRFGETCCGLTRKVTLAGFELYLTVNPKPDGTPGEVFCKMALGGPEATLPGLIQAFVVMLSTALQSGASWLQVRDRIQGMRFEPSDASCTSLPDGIVQSIDAMVPELREVVRRRVGQQVLDFDADESKRKKHESRTAGHGGY